MFYIDDSVARELHHRRPVVLRGRAMMQRRAESGGAPRAADERGQLHPGPQDRHPRRAGRAWRVRRRRASASNSARSAGCSAAIYHYEYFDRLEKLRHAYYYFNPELDAARPLRAARRIDRAYAELIDAVHRRAQGRQLRRGAARGDRARASRATSRCGSRSRRRSRISARCASSAAASTTRPSRSRAGSACASDTIEVAGL